MTYLANGILGDVMAAEVERAGRVDIESDEDGLG